MHTRFSEICTVILSIIVVNARPKGTNNSKMIEITGTRYEYSPAEYDISKCNPTIDLDFVKMLKTNGNCVNIYPSSNCTGWFIRFAYRDSYIRFPKTYRWVGDEVMPRGLEIGSVGPCFDKCDVRNWYGDRKQEPAHVTLYGERDFRGNSTSISIDGDGCFLIPLGFGTWIHSMKITGDENSCIELHDVASCGGKFTQFRPDYPELQNLFGWVLEDKDTFASLVKAISRCGQFCNKSVPDINPKSVAPIWGKNIVTLYKYQGHYGHSVNLNLTNGCVSLANERQYAVVQTYGQCVVLYGLANCEEKQGFYTLQTRKLIYLTIPVYPKSMKLCGDDDEQVELVDEEKFGLENTSSHVSIPIWAVILFCVGALFVLVFTAVRGACVYKSYANIDNKRQVERLSVAYKSDA
ncbi:uncharacterized protein LOC110861570 [Folsomia candida]|uniref:uncharacterized protein LOC110861570 n=1 Tax=Folsomia candida TaxID=158441 RepID=UPI0016051CC8|nr:uncharacterized protein LOC110861570 [Folsomia candida]